MPRNLSVMSIVKKKIEKQPFVILCKNSCTVCKKKKAAVDINPTNDDAVRLSYCLNRFSPV